MLVIALLASILSGSVFAFLHIVVLKYGIKLPALHFLCSWSARICIYSYPVAGIFLAAVVVGYIGWKRLQQENNWRRIFKATSYALLTAYLTMSLWGFIFVNMYGS